MLILILPTSKLLSTHPCHLSTITKPPARMRHRPASDRLAPEARFSVWEGEQECFHRITALECRWSEVSYSLGAIDDSLTKHQTMSSTLTWRKGLALPERSFLTVRHSVGICIEQATREWNCIDHALMTFSSHAPCCESCSRILHLKNSRHQQAKEYRSSYLIAGESSCQPYVATDHLFLQIHHNFP